MSVSTCKKSKIKITCIIILWENLKKLKPTKKISTIKMTLIPTYFRTNLNKITSRIYRLTKTSLLNRIIPILTLQNKITKKSSKNSTNSHILLTQTFTNPKIKTKRIKTISKRPVTWLKTFKMKRNNRILILILDNRKA